MQAKLFKDLFKDCGKDKGDKDFRLFGRAM
jgi:hypothetical protein